MKPLSKPLLFFASILAVPITVHAHLIGGAGLSSGLAHPLLGLDHLLAMLAVGVISAKIGGRAIIIVPTAFVSFMTIGGMLAIAGIAFPAVETGIALSVLFFGAMIALSKSPSLKLAIVLVALFALFHGHAHGEEMPVIASPALYALGFVASTAILHFSGALLGHYAKKTVFRTNLLRLSGAAMSTTGMLFLAGTL
ncbi:MAG: HupE/UreJ family protein [Candidatus Diapherotrites archaeon]|nr:HupE/UreJ family protein [Candidatus Diapherotrites archaeon]